MKKVTLALIGAGDRGMNCYAPYTLENPWKAEFVAVAERDPEKRRQFAESYHISPKYCFDDFEEMLKGPKVADAVMICTSDQLHFKPAVQAMEKGYHIMMEKPMSTTPEQCMALWKASRTYDRMFILCFVLRYTEFFSTIYQVIKSGRIGMVNSINHMENIPLIDQVHAFTRGIFRKAETACPIILSHCCHDLDIISWFAGSRCKKIASFGGLTFFCEKNAPEGSPKRCLDGCPVSSQCKYYAPNYYLTEDIGWPTSTIGTDMSFEGRLQALQASPYGRCVFHCDNDVADNQTVIMEFENGVTANFSLQPFASESGRTMKITGTRGEIQADMEKNIIQIFDHLTGRIEHMQVKPSRYKYGGGDHGIMEYFIDQVSKEAQGGWTSMDSSIEAHMIAFAAEKSRKESVVVDMDTFRKQMLAG